MRTAFIRRRIHLAHARASTFHTKPQRDPSRTDLAVHTTYSLCPPYTSEKPNEVLTRDLLTKSTPHPLSPPRALVQTPAEMVTIQRGVSLNQSTNAAFQHTNQPTNQPTNQTGRFNGSINEPTGRFNEPINQRGVSTNRSTNQRGGSTNTPTNQRTHQRTNGYANEPRTQTPEGVLRPTLVRDRETPPRPHRKLHQEPLQLFRWTEVAAVQRRQHDRPTHVLPFHGETQGHAEERHVLQARAEHRS